MKALWVALALGLAGCGSSGGDDGPSGGHAHDLSGSTCPPGSALTYDTFARDFMTRYCTECHSSAVAARDRQGAPSDHNFDTLGGIRETEEGHLDEQSAAGPDRVNTAMPPAGSPQPSEEERRKLGEWLACGMP